jgi:hypothetical protein
MGRDASQEEVRAWGPPWPAPCAAGAQPSTRAPSALPAAAPPHGSRPPCRPGRAHAGAGSGSGIGDQDRTAAGGPQHRAAGPRSPPGRPSVPWCGRLGLRSGRVVGAQSVGACGGPRRVCGPCRDAAPRGVFVRLMLCLPLLPSFMSACCSGRLLLWRRGPKHTDRCAADQGLRQGRGEAAPRGTREIRGERACCGLLPLWFSPVCLARPQAVLC